MGLTKNLFLTVFSALLCRDAGAQQFTNLNFEDAAIVQDSSSPFYPNAVFASDAIPGWTAEGFISPNDILYNDISLGSPSVSLLGNGGGYSALDGSFSIDLYGGFGGSGASITQTGVVPFSTASILFITQNAGALGGTLLVSLGGHNIPLLALSTGPNYTISGWDVSEFAGQSE